MKSLKLIVVDEADLVFSYGYEQDMEKISKYMPKICQGFLASATLGSTVESLKKLILHTPVVLKLEEEKDKRLLLKQYVVKNQGWDEKFLQLYVLLKMKIISGKTIVFVNSIEGCYRLKLFLERLSVKSAVLNSELPQNSRYHIVQEFNKGLFNVLIATDEANKGEADDSDDEKKNESSSSSSSASSSSSSSPESSDSESSEPTKSKKSQKAESKPKSKAEAAKNEKSGKAGKKKVGFVDSDSSSSEDDELMDGESFSSDAMDVDGDDEDIENMSASSEDGSDNSDSDEGQTVDEARKEAEEAIKEIDGQRNVTKSALKFMQQRLADINKAQIREDAANENSDSDEDDNGSDNEEAAPKKAESSKKGASSTTKVSLARGRAPRRGGPRADAEYGVSRGVDFRGIKTVVNFDFPRSSRAYTHRVGRTARAGQAGTALSFVTGRDSELLETVIAAQKAEGLEVKPYNFNSAALDSFRYRVEGVLRTVTDLSIREARYEEIRREILGSQKLETFFQENPREMELLKHDKSLLESKINPRLKTVPDYILTQPELADNQQLADKDHEEQYLEHFGARKRFGKRRLTSDPLKTFSHPAKKHKGKEDGKAGRGGRRGRRHQGVGSGFGPGT